MKTGIPFKPSESHADHERRADTADQEAQDAQGPQLAHDLLPRPDPPPRRPRGFATMDKARVSEIARKGGQAAHSAGTAHEFTGEEARIAGSKGGRMSHAKRREALRRQQAERQAPPSSRPDKRGR